MRIHSDTVSVWSKHEWFTVTEAVAVINRLTDLQIRDYDIYRYALAGRITLSVYFQSPVFLRKIRMLEGKIKLTTTDGFLNRLCILDTGCFLTGRNLIISTEGSFYCSAKQIFDTALLGYEYVQLQHLLARALRLPRPRYTPHILNYGVTVTHCGETFQLFENVAWYDQTKKQIAKIPICHHLAAEGRSYCLKMHDRHRRGYFPLHQLPYDACFVLRHTELERLCDAVTCKDTPASSRMSTPLTRLFWLSCKNNDAIRPLINQPYKLLAIFEQWASDEGLTDKLNGDTLKTALQRGSPAPVKNPHD